MAHRGRKLTTAAAALGLALLGLNPPGAAAAVRPHRPRP